MGSVGAAAATVTPPVENHRLRNLLIGALALIVCGALAQLLGWNIRGWFQELWDTITTISWPYIVGAIVLLTVQTVTVAFAWFWILKYAYPESGVRGVRCSRPTRRRSA